MANLYVCGHCKERTTTKAGHGPNCRKRQAGRGDWDVRIEGSASITYDGVVYGDTYTTESSGYGGGYSDSGGTCGGSE